MILNEEELTLKLKSLLPKEFIVEGATNYPDTECAKVRGLIGKSAITIEWLYNEFPDTLILSITRIDGTNLAGECLVENLKSVLEKENLS